MCYSNTTNELYVCGCTRSPARCDTAKIRFRAATTFEEKLLAICPGNSGVPDDTNNMITRDLCAWCWEKKRLPTLTERYGKKFGSAGGGGSSDQGVSKDNNNKEKGDSNEKGKEKEKGQEDRNGKQEESREGEYNYRRVTV